MYQKSTDFFYDPQLKLFSGNKLQGKSCISRPKMAQKGAFFEIFKPIVWAKLSAHGNCPCTKSVLIFFWIHKLTQNGPKISKNAPFWAISGQLIRFIPRKRLELQIQKKNLVDFWYMGNYHSA